MTSIQSFRVIRRPANLTSTFSLVVTDNRGHPHLPLTIFYHRLQQQGADGTARTYLNSVLSFFTYLTTDECKQNNGDQWDATPVVMQESIRDYLVYRLGCKVQPKDTYAFVKLTVQSPPTVRLFLAALKQFYAIMHREGKYIHCNPLLNAASNLLREIEYEERSRRHRMPQISGIEEPAATHSTENFFRVANETWEVLPVDDPLLGKTLVEGFVKADLCLRDQIVVRLLLETGTRIGEILALTVGDWRSCGSNQEARAQSKGSRGRRVKTLRFSSTTARMLRQYLNTDRLLLDLNMRRFEQLSNDDPLFLSHRRKPYSYEALKPHWYKLCQVVQLDLNIHALRHWYVTMAMRMIVEESKNSAEIVVRKEELVRYMGWRNPETLNIYENYFKGIQHYVIQDQVHQCLAQGVIEYAIQAEENHSPQSPQRNAPLRVEQTFPETHKQENHQGWAKLLALGGAR